MTMTTRSAEEWAGDGLFEWMLTDPFPTKPGIEKPSEHEARQRRMLVEIMAKKMVAYAQECVEAWRERAVVEIHKADGFRLQSCCLAYGGTSFPTLMAEALACDSRILSAALRAMSMETP